MVATHSTTLIIDGKRYSIGVIERFPRKFRDIYM